MERGGHLKNILVNNLGIPRWCIFTPDTLKIAKRNNVTTMYKKINEAVLRAMLHKKNLNIPLNV